jgi:transcriptional regulator with XRE-family HTH domain
MQSPMVMQWGMKSDMRVPNGFLLTAARHAVGLTQAELARAAGIDPTTLSRMENAGAKPVGGKTQNLQAVLDALRANGVEVLEDGLRLVSKRRGR